MPILTLRRFRIPAALKKSKGAVQDTPELIEPEDDTSYDPLSLNIMNLSRSRTPNIASSREGPDSAAVMTIFVKILKNRGRSKSDKKLLGTSGDESACPGRAKSVPLVFLKDAKSCPHQSTVADLVYNKLKPDDPDRIVDVEAADGQGGCEFSAAQIAEFRKVFNAFDRDGNDSIGVEELGAVLKALGYSPSESDIDKVLSRFDSDSSGDLSFDEYLALMAVWVEEDESQIIEAFKVFDRSGDGFVTISELKSALCRFGEKFTEEEAEEFFNLIDVNHDGIINYEEFVKYMLSEINRAPPPRVVAT